MTIVVDFHYEATVTAGGGDEKRSYADSVSFDPGTVLAQDAPVALRVGSADYVRDEYRVVAGTFLRSTFVLGDSRALAWDVMTALPQHGFKNVNQGLVKRRGTPPADRTVRCDRDAVLAKLNALLADAVFVDGVLYLPCGQPFVRRSDRETLVSTGGRYGIEERYRPDEKDLAEAAGFGFPQGIQVVDPTLLTDDFAAERLQLAIGEVAKVASQVAGYLPAEAIADFVHARSALSRYRDRPYDVAEALPAAGRILSVIRSAGLDGLVYGLGHVERRLALFEADAGRDRTAKAAALDEDAEALAMMARF